MSFAYSGRLNTWLLVGFLLVGGYYSFIGFRYTWYGYGLYFGVPGILLLAAVVAALINVKIRELWFWWRWFTGLSISAFLVLIVQHHIEHYKPTVRLHIPEKYQGSVTLLPGKQVKSDFYVNSIGIAYWKAEGEVNLKVLHGDRDITGVLNESGYQQFFYYNADRSMKEQIAVTCFEVEKGRNYPDNPWNQYHAQCMDKVKFGELVREGIIDESKVCRTRYVKKKSAFHPIKGQCF